MKAPHRCLALGKVPVVCNHDSYNLPLHNSHAWTDVTESWVLKALVPSLGLEAVIPGRALGGHLAQFFLANEETEAQGGEAVLSDPQQVRDRAGSHVTFSHTHAVPGFFRSFSLLADEVLLTSEGPGP